MNRNNHGRGLAQRPPAPAPAPQGQGGTDGAAGQTHSPCCPPELGGLGKGWGPPADVQTDTQPCQAPRTPGQPRHEAPAGTQQRPRFLQTLALCCPSEGWGHCFLLPKITPWGRATRWVLLSGPLALSLLPGGTATAPGPGGPHGFSAGAASSGRLCIVTLRGGGGHGASPPAPLTTPEQRWGSARLRFAPRWGEHRRQQLPATAPCPSQPRHRVGGTTPSPAAAPRCPLGPGSRQRGGTGDTRRWGGPRDRRRVTQTDRHQRYILFCVCVLCFFFLQRQGPGTAGGGRVLSVVPGKGIDSNLQPPPLSCSPPLPRCVPGAGRGQRPGGILRWPRAPSCSS